MTRRLATKRSKRCNSCFVVQIIINTAMTAAQTVKDNLPQMTIQRKQESTKATGLFV